VVLHILDHFDEFVGRSVVVSGGLYQFQEMIDAFTKVTGRPTKYVQVPKSYMGIKSAEQMFAGFEEFGSFAHGTGFTEVKQMDYVHTTLTEFWENNGWNVPSSS
ncbi:hypothetical protein EV175_007248, partial [Coemansia sp. RSA 1933]